MTRLDQRRRAYSDDGTDGLLPLVEVFGGAFAVLIVLFLIIRLFSGVLQTRMLKPDSAEGPVRIAWVGGGSGWTVIARPDRVNVIEGGSEALKSRICAERSPFRRFVKRKYAEGQSRIALVILDGGVDVALEARNCIHQLAGTELKLSWIIVDAELLKSLSVNQIPPYVRTVSNFQLQRRDGP